MTRPTTTSGGKHDVTWADCTGTVYDQAIRPPPASGAALEAESSALSGAPPTAHSSPTGRGRCCIGMTSRPPRPRERSTHPTGRR